MAAHKLTHTLPENGQVKRPRELQHNGNGIGGTATLQLIQKPETLLSKREREIACTCDRDQRHAPQALNLLLSRRSSGSNRRRKVCNRGRGKKLANRELHMQFFTDS